MLIDFEYDGKKISDEGYIICHITDSADAEAISISSPLTFDTQTQKALNRFRPTSVYYSEPYICTFQISKNFCENGKAPRITESDVRSLMNWLNFRGHAKFKPIYDNLDYCNIYCNGSFNVQAIRIAGEIVGFELTFTADSPFAFYDPITMEWEFSEADTFSVYDTSDECGWIYPKVEITYLGIATGNIEIKNNRESFSTVIANCEPDEVIYLDGHNKIIDSSLDHPTLYNDFSYNFPRIHNDRRSNENVFTVSAPCKIKMTYSPVCKVGVI